jgi:hypothetical protein
MLLVQCLDYTRTILAVERRNNQPVEEMTNEARELLLQWDIGGEATQSGESMGVVLNCCAIQLNQKWGTTLSSCLGCGRIRRPYMRNQWKIKPILY